MKKSTRIVKRLLALFLVVLMSIESIAAVVGDNDGSAFITKAEFDSLKNDFQSQIDQYNTSIDSKIDGAIASYLAGITMAKTMSLEPAVTNYNSVYWTDTLLIKWLRKDWYDSSTGGRAANSVADSYRWGCPPKERFHVLNANQMWFNIFGVQTQLNDEYYGQYWNAYLDFNESYQGDYSSAPFTSNMTTGQSAAGAPHFLVLRPDDTGQFVTTDVRREYALTNVMWFGLQNSTGDGTSLRNELQNMVLSYGDDNYKLESTTNSATPTTWSAIYPANKVQLDILYSLAWNNNTTSRGAKAKTSNDSAGVNNSLVRDYRWNSFATDGETSIVDYINYSLWGDIDSNDTATVIYQAENGIYDWSSTTSYTIVPATVRRYNTYRISTNRDVQVLTPISQTLNLAIPNFPEISLSDLTTKIGYSGGWLKHGQGMPIHLNIPDNGVLTIDFELESKNYSLGNPKFSISKNDFLHAYDSVKGVLNGGSSQIELKDVSLSQAKNKLQMNVKNGDNIWMNIKVGNNQNTSSSNNRVILIKELKLTLNAGDEL